MQVGMYMRAYDLRGWKKFFLVCALTKIYSLHISKILYLRCRPQPKLSSMEHLKNELTLCVYTNKYKLMRMNKCNASKIGYDFF